MDKDANGLGVRGAGAPGLIRAARQRPPYRGGRVLAVRAHEESVRVSLPRLLRALAAANRQFRPISDCVAARTIASASAFRR